MRSSYRRIAMSLLDKFKDYRNVEFSVDVWFGPIERPDMQGFGVRVDWDDQGVRPHGIFFHADSEDEATAVLDAINTVRGSLHHARNTR